LRDDGACSPKKEAGSAPRRIPACRIRVYRATRGARPQSVPVSFISANVGNYIIVIILIWVAGLIASLGVILCVIGVIFTQFWSYLVTGNLMGQLAGGGEPAELAVSAES